MGCECPRGLLALFLQLQHKDRYATSGHILLRLHVVVERDEDFKARDFSAVSSASFLVPFHRRRLTLSQSWPFKSRASEYGVFSSNRTRIQLANSNPIASRICRCSQAITAWACSRDTLGYSSTNSSKPI